MQVLIVYYLLFRKIVFVYESLFDVVLPLNNVQAQPEIQHPRKLSLPLNHVQAEEAIGFGFSYIASYLLKFITIYYWYCCAAYLIKMFWCSRYCPLPLKLTQWTVCLLPSSIFAYLYFVINNIIWQNCVRIWFIYLSIYILYFWSIHITLYQCLI